MFKSSKKEKIVILTLFGSILMIYLFMIKTIERHQLIEQQNFGVQILNESSIKNLGKDEFSGPGIIYPETKGSLNPDINQGNISKNICNPHWSTKSIRPSTSYTNRLKASQIKEYGYLDTNLKNYEEDHIISLELGGSPTDPNNLWPEPYTIMVNGENLGARAKDKVENYLHKEVCAGRMTLSDAQQKISNDWYAVYKSIGTSGQYSDTDD